MCLQMIPRSFVESYWKDVSNPISLNLPNGSDCKMYYWVQQGDDIWLQNWKRFARSLRCGDLLVFQYKGGSDFHVIIFDDSKLEIDYSSMRNNDGQEEEERENTEQPLKKKKINSNDSVATPQGTNIDDQEEEEHEITDQKNWTAGTKKKKCNTLKD
ncbi:B3 domain-containing protein [Trifolium pratense]|uniref:B3 domain-containing protein n=1 Tax=Trifolium pratense TaxID=57577 RepID=A0A2K3JVX0_TRIPR|nr:B3 domain-containing protein [Trifolium pratense]